MSFSSTLLLDCNYLCRRAQHTTGSLEHVGIRTGVLFGFFRDLIILHDEFPNCRVVFCFDHGGSIRKEVYPNYKKSRETAKRQKTVDEIAEDKQFYRQIKNLREVHLTEMGFNNVFAQPRYEADDLIASLVGSCDGEIVIVSSDRDLFQLLSERVKIWNPQMQFMRTLKGFQKEFGISPREWIKVKAIAGCHTDDIAGIQGVGEITACKYLRGELKKESVAYQNIKAGRSLIHDNKLLVRLPFPGTKICKLQDDNLTMDKWNGVVNQLGLKTLRNRAPLPLRISK